jgi:hypothetical protein
MAGGAAQLRYQIADLESKIAGRQAARPKLFEKIRVAIWRMPTRARR